MREPINPSTRCLICNAESGQWQLLCAKCCPPLDQKEMKKDNDSKTNIRDDKASRRKIS